MARNIIIDHSRDEKSDAIQPIESPIKLYVNRADGHVIGIFLWEESWFLFNLFLLEILSFSPDWTLIFINMEHYVIKQLLFH